MFKGRRTRARKALHLSEVDARHLQLHAVRSLSGSNNIESALFFPTASTFCLLAMRTKKKERRKKPLASGAEASHPAAPNLESIPVSSADRTHTSHTLARYIPSISTHQWLCRSFGTTMCFPFAAYLERANQQANQRASSSSIAPRGNS